MNSKNVSMSIGEPTPTLKVQDSTNATCLPIAFSSTLLSPLLSLLRCFYASLGPATCVGASSIINILTRVAASSGDTFSIHCIGVFVCEYHRINSMSIPWGWYCWESLGCWWQMQWEWCEILSMTMVLATMYQRIVSDWILSTLDKTHLIFFKTAEGQKPHSLAQENE